MRSTPVSVALIALGLAIATGSCRSVQSGSNPALNLFRPEELAKWTPTPGYEKDKPWQFKDGVYGGFHSWIAHPAVFGDFSLQVEIKFLGKRQGGIVIRGDAKSRQPWQNGYELDIDWHPDRKHGHIHFPVKPKPYGGSALIEVGKWHTVRIQAQGEHVVVFLDGRQALEFTDKEFSRGNICLEGEIDGVQYRNLKVSPLGR